MIHRLIRLSPPSINLPSPPVHPQPPTFKSSIQHATTLPSSPHLLPPSPPTYPFPQFSPSHAHSSIPHLSPSPLTTLPPSSLHPLPFLPIVLNPHLSSPLTSYLSPSPLTTPPPSWPPLSPSLPFLRPLGSYQAQRYTSSTSASSEAVPYHRFPYQQCFGLAQLRRGDSMEDCL